LPSRFKIRYYEKRLRKVKKNAESLECRVNRYSSILVIRRQALRKDFEED